MQHGRRRAAAAALGDGVDFAGTSLHMGGGATDINKEDRQRAYRRSGIAVCRACASVALARVVVVL